MWIEVNPTTSKQGLSSRSSRAADFDQLCSSALDQPNLASEEKVATPKEDVVSQIGGMLRGVQHFLKNKT